MVVLITSGIIFLFVSGSLYLVHSDAFIEAFKSTIKMTLKGVCKKWMINISLLFLDIRKSVLVVLKGKRKYKL